MWAVFGDSRDEGLQIFASWRSQNFAIAACAFVDSEAQLGRYQWLDALKKEIVELGAGLAADFDGVLESGGGDQRCASTLALQQSIGSDSRTVEEHELTFGGDFPEGLDDGLGRIGRSGKHLQHAQAATLKPDTVGERAASVDGDAKRLGAAAHGVKPESQVNTDVMLLLPGQEADGAAPGGTY